MEALRTQRWRDSFLMHMLLPRVQSKVHCVSLYQNCTSGTWTGVECDWQVIALQNLYSRKKAKDLLFLCANVAIHINLSSVNQVPRRCIRNNQREICFSSPAHLVMQGEREREKDQTKLWHAMVSVFYGDWQYRNTWERYRTCQGITWIHSNF